MNYLATGIIALLAVAGLFFPQQAQRLGGTVVAVFQGGTGTTTAPVSQVLYGGTGGHYQSTPTTTASCTGSSSCSSFTVLGATPVSISSSGGSPGGSDTQVQFNNSGSFDGNWGLTYQLNASRPTLRVGDISSTTIQLQIGESESNSWADVYGQNYDGSSYFDLYAATTSGGGSDFDLFDETGEVYFRPAGGVEYFHSLLGPSGNFVLSSTTPLFAGQVLSTTTSSVSGALTAGVCDSTTSTIPGASMSSTTVLETTPQKYPGDGVTWYSYVTNATTIVTKMCGLTVVSPAATAFNVDVLQ